MNRAKLKNYAPQARRDFIQAVTDRAAYYGLTPNKIEPVIEKGEIALIGGRAFPLTLARKRKALEDRISRKGFERIMEAMAYTWFNRLVAIRFMELHGYFDHGYRVLSNPEGKMIPEILEHAQHVDLPGLNKDKVIELKLDGSREDELYRLVLIAQCNALHSAMPFLFEWVNDETELLLPDNLLHSDSLIRKLVNEIDEEDWQEVEIIGWLYQFYISEKKNQVIGKVVKSEDIPAATQLFTPNWIVKYMVQNTLGRQWLATYPNSSLRQKMEFYIEPTEQTAEVNAQLKAITPDSLDPEKLTLLDPACGSGHILVEAYDLLKEIYLERGFRGRDIPRLILEKNLYGLDIDDRAAQMAGFALLMKARKEDRRILLGDNPLRVNVMAIQKSGDLDARKIAQSFTLTQRDGLDNSSVTSDDIVQLIGLFKHGKDFGSLITIPEVLAGKLSAMIRLVEETLAAGDLFAQDAAMSLKPLVIQALQLGMKYDCVVANPPYMGGKGMAPFLKQYSKKYYPRCQPNLYAMFVERAYKLCRLHGSIGYVTMHSWMFLPTFEAFRRWLLENGTILSMAHLGARAFGAISGEVVQTTAFTYFVDHLGDYHPTFLDATDGEEHQKMEILRQKQKYTCHIRQSKFGQIPGSPIAYWVTDAVVNAFRETRLKNLAEIRAGIGTSDNNRFLRCWYEVCFDDIGYDCTNILNAKESGKTWFPYTKGGKFRKWYGNNEYLINWKDDGKEIKHAVVNNPTDPNTTHWSRRIFNTEYFFLPSITWSDIGGGPLSVRKNESCSIHDAVGVGAYRIVPESAELGVLAMLNSRVANVFIKILCPTLHFKAGQMGEIPVILTNDLATGATECVDIAKQDWNSSETSWGFSQFPVIANHRNSMRGAFEEWNKIRLDHIARLVELESEQNTKLICAYGFGDFLSPNVNESEITLDCPNRSEDTKRLISYAIGCMMGRYSLDKPGLVYAHSGNKGFDPSQYKTFPAGQDGIIPVMEADWFSEDASNRIVEFVSVAWPKEHLEENLRFIAESLGPNREEQPRDTIRRYLTTGFFKDHLKTYKKRPIYWLFSSGKLRAFQCLVYLHRYNEVTLSRMRTEYVIPLQGKSASRIEQLSGDMQKASSTSHRKKMEKERDILFKQQAELQSFDEKLRHYADIRISLDLDDGVKVNYGKFGDLLVEVKTVTGGSQE